MQVVYVHSSTNMFFFEELDLWASNIPLSSGKPHHCWFNNSTSHARSASGSIPMRKFPSSVLKHGQVEIHYNIYSWRFASGKSFITYLVGGLEHDFFGFPTILGISSTQLTYSYFSEGVGQPPTSYKFEDFP